MVTAWFGSEQNRACIVTKRKRITQKKLPGNTLQIKNGDLMKKVKLYLFQQCFLREKEFGLEQMNLHQLKIRILMLAEFIFSTEILIGKKSLGLTVLQITEFIHYAEPATISGPVCIPSIEKETLNVAGAFT